MVQLCCLDDRQFPARDVRTSILLHMMKFENVFKYNLIKISRLEHSIKSMFNTCCSNRVLWNHSRRLSVCLSVRCPSLRSSLGFLKIQSLVFSDVIYDDSWPLYLANDGVGFSRKKNLAAGILTKWAKIEPKTRFFAIFSSLVHYFPLKLNTMIACNSA